LSSGPLTALGKEPSFSPAYNITAAPICLRFERHFVWRLDSIALVNAGKRSAASTATIELTVKSSMIVKADAEPLRELSSGAREHRGFPRSGWRSLRRVLPAPHR
jgi:hypothetical protein